MLSMSARRFTGWLLLSLLATTSARAASLDKIEKTRQASRLSADQAILFKVQTLKGATSLPLEFLPDERMVERCGSRVVLEAHQNWDSYTPATQSRLAAILQRPSQEKTHASPDGIFLIHYDTAGGQAVPSADLDTSGIPDYVENLARYADSSYRMEVLQMGYRPPLSDGAGLYDIYTQEIPYYGYCEPVSNQCFACASFIVVHRDFFGFPPNDDPEGDQKGAMKVTIAHELHHAVQFAYTVVGSAWFFESTSTWMEDVVFDLVNDNYWYLPAFFSQPALPLTYNSIHMYGCFIWNQYLAQNFGADIIRQVWEENALSPAAATSLDQVLRNRYASDLAKEFSRFALWNFYTGRRDDGRHYEEGDHYPEMELHFNTGGPVFSGRSDTIFALAAQYVSFPSANTIEKAQLTFTGRATGEWGAHVVFHNPYSSRAYPFNLIGKNQGDTTFFGLDSFPQVVLIGAQIKTGQLSASEYFDYGYKPLPFYIRGDLNEDLAVNSQDIVYQINFLFLGILPPENRLEAAELNCDGRLSAADLVLLLHLVFLFLPPPC